MYQEWYKATPDPESVKIMLGSKCESLKGSCMIFNDFLETVLSGYSTECYFRIRWKIYCPGCGGSRAFIALIRGHVAQSIKYNPIVVLFFVDIFATMMLCIIGRKHKQYTVAKIRKMMNITFFHVYNIIFSDT